MGEVSRSDGGGHLHPIKRSDHWCILIRRGSESHLTTREPIMTHFHAAEYCVINGKHKSCVRTSESYGLFNATLFNQTGVTIEHRKIIRNASGKPFSI